MAKRITHTSPIPGYDPNRDNMWTRNAEAIRRFIGGGTVEYKDDKGRWVPYVIRHNTVPLVGRGYRGHNQDSGMSIFGKRECRVPKQQGINDGGKSH